MWFSGVIEDADCNRSLDTRVATAEAIANELQVVDPDGKDKILAVIVRETGLTGVARQEINAFVEDPRVAIVRRAAWRIFRIVASVIGAFYIVWAILFAILGAGSTGVASDVVWGASIAFAALACAQISADSVSELLSQMLMFLLTWALVVHVIPPEIPTFVTGICAALLYIATFVLTIRSARARWRHTSLRH